MCGPGDHPPYPHPSHVTVSGPGHTTGLDRTPADPPHPGCSVCAPAYTIAPAAVCAACTHPYAVHWHREAGGTGLPPCSWSWVTPPPVCDCGAFVLGARVPTPGMLAPDDRPEPDESGLEMPFQAGAWRE